MTRLTEVARLRARVRELEAAIGQPTPREAEVLAVLRARGRVDGSKALWSLLGGPSPAWPTLAHVTAAVSGLRRKLIAAGEVERLTDGRGVYALVRLVDGARAEACA